MRQREVLSLWCVWWRCAHAGGRRCAARRREGPEAGRAVCVRSVYVREAAHVRLGATMASELAEKRRAIAWVELSDGRDVDSSDPGSEESLHFSYVKGRCVSRFQRDFQESRDFPRKGTKRAASARAEPRGAAVRRRSFVAQLGMLGRRLTAGGWVGGPTISGGRDFVPMPILVRGFTRVPPLAHAGGSTAGWANHR